MGFTAVVGAVFSAARDHGDVGGCGIVCFVGGVTYALNLFCLKRRS
jgi:1,4-dihydroxy-2-naphthoate octaprenyltransferase